MDALRAIKEEMERKRRAAGAGASAASPAEGESAPKRYIRRGDLHSGVSTSTLPAVLSGSPPSTARSSSTTDADTSAATKSHERGSADSLVNSTAANTATMSKEEVVARLRKIGQPATLFGEGDWERSKRLSAYLREHGETAAALATSAGDSSGPLVAPDRSAGVHMPMLASAATAAQVVVAGEEAPALPDAPTTGELGADAEHTDGAPAKRRRVDDAPDAGLSASVEAAGVSGGVGGGGVPDSDSDDGKGKMRTVSSQAAAYRDRDDYKYIYKYFKGLLNEWEDELSKRSEAQRRSPAGKDETALHKQSKEFMRPLFKLCKKRTLPVDVRNLCKEIVMNCEEREYAKAGDAYIRLAIGNAAWPIGVTAVGLHERAAREKVAQGKQAHVLHNEESRKYVTILKRLISWAQRAYPGDPSKSVWS